MRNFRLWAFFVVQIFSYSKLLARFLGESTVFNYLVIFELGNLLIDLFGGFYKYTVNFYEALINATWSTKHSWFSFVDMILACIEIIFKVTSLGLFMLKFDYPIAWARDLIIAVGNCFKRITEYSKG